jgi:hypothetical protein
MDQLAGKEKKKVAKMEGNRRLDEEVGEGRY